jgi:hypothetical protein
MIDLLRLALVSVYLVIWLGGSCALIACNVHF